MANEEKLLNNLLSQGKSLVNEKNFEEAIKMLNEAYQLEKWRELYGG